ncbi:unnamed protein product [Prorocentrum cordatum]|uniref:Uncharacterized protein n=1 Tax=Prorocentrum cordatum TaxID=2364126 RepID=A0ABN9R2Z0_9DINO|nr:unnamed protein product [Polarella glacialis]
MSAALGFPTVAQVRTTFSWSARWRWRTSSSAGGECRPRVAASTPNQPDPSARSAASRTTTSGRQGGCESSSRRARLLWSVRPSLEVGVPGTLAIQFLARSDGTIGSCILRGATPQARLAASASQPSK